MHSEGILAGELKHGPLALVDKEMPVIMIIMRDACYSKCENALQQITARSVSSERTYPTFNKPAGTEPHTWSHALSHICSARNNDCLTNCQSFFLSPSGSSYHPLLQR